MACDRTFKNNIMDHEGPKKLYRIKLNAHIGCRKIEYFKTYTRHSRVQYEEFRDYSTDSKCVYWPVKE